MHAEHQHHPMCSASPSIFGAALESHWARSRYPDYGYTKVGSVGIGDDIPALGPVHLTVELTE